jgi:hypothetical protein
MAELYIMLDGSAVDLSGLTPRQVRILREVEERARDGMPYTDLIASLFHPLSPLWNGQTPSTALAHGPLFQVLPDLCARVAIEHAQFEQDFIPVSEYARIKGVSRQAVYAAAARGLIRLEQHGAVSAIVVDAGSRQWHPSPVRQAAGRTRGARRASEREHEHQSAAGGSSFRMKGSKPPLDGH